MLKDSGEWCLSWPFELRRRQYPRLLVIPRGKTMGRRCDKADRQSEMRGIRIVIGTMLTSADRSFSRHAALFFCSLPVWTEKRHVSNKPPYKRGKGSLTKSCAPHLTKWLREGIRTIRSCFFQPSVCALSQPPEAVPADKNRFYQKWFRFKKLVPYLLSPFSILFSNPLQE